MYNQYTYRLISRGYEEGSIQKDYGYIGNYDRIKDFVTNKYIEFTKSYDSGFALLDSNEKKSFINEIIKSIDQIDLENWDKINNDDKLSPNELVIVSSKFYNFEYVLEKYLDITNPIQFELEKFKLNEFDDSLGSNPNPNPNYSKILIESMVVIKKLNEFGEESIQIKKTINTFKKIQGKYLNMLEHSVCVYNIESGEFETNPDENSNLYIDTMRKLKWFLSVHFANKVLDLEYIENKIAQAKNFIIGLDRMVLNLDFDGLLELKYLVKFV
jgi:hypothetical protein